jgi:hypothetical protein
MLIFMALCVQQELPHLCLLPLLLLLLLHVLLHVAVRLLPLLVMAAAAVQGLDDTTAMQTAICSSRCQVDL